MNTQSATPKSDFGIRRDAELCIQIVSILSGVCDDCPNRACRRARTCTWQHPTCYDRTGAADSAFFAAAMEFAGQVGMLAPLPDDPDGTAHLAKLERMRERINAGRRYRRRYPGEFEELRGLRSERGGASEFMGLWKPPSPRCASRTRSLPRRGREEAPHIKTSLYAVAPPRPAC